MPIDLLAQTGFLLLAALAMLAALVLLVFIAWWALFSDRPDGRRRCPRCWHDMTYTAGMRCTECGLVARGEREFGRTRRKRGIAVLAIVGCTAIGLFVVDRAQAVGWMSYVPTRGLLAMMPIVNNPRGPVLGDLDRRIKAGVLTDGDWLALIERCREGNRRARPPSTAWAAKYGQFLGFARQRIATADDFVWRKEAGALLLTIPPQVDVSTRKSWPAGVAPALDVVADAWWPTPVQWRIRAHPQVEGATPDVHILLDQKIQPRSYSISIPPLPAGRHDVAIDLEIERRLDERDDEDGWSPVERRTVRVPIKVDGVLAEMLVPAQGDDLDALIRETFRNGVVRYTRGGSLPVRVNVDSGRTFVVPFEDTAVGVRVEVLRNGQLGRMLDIWWAAGPDELHRQHAWEVPMVDEAVLAAPADSRDVWTLRVTGRPDLALRVDGASRYWAGEVVVAAPVRTLGRRAPSRGWIPVDQARTAEGY